MTPEVDVSFELAEARRRLGELESLVEISPVAIVLMDADERVTGWNPAAASSPAPDSSVVRTQGGPMR